MRTIKFRGKRINRNGEWAYGDLRILPDRTLILPQGSYDAAIDRDAVDEKTIGQFTGLLDKNGKEIYEGDIVHLGDPRITYVLLWIDCGLKAKQIGAYGSFCGVTYWAETMTIVGNIHDNPELMKGK